MCPKYFWLFWMVLLWTFMYKHWFETCFQFFCLYLEMELVGHVVILYLIFWRPAKLFAKAVAPFYIHWQYLRLPLSLHVCQHLISFTTTAYKSCSCCTYSNSDASFIYWCRTWWLFKGVWTSCVSLSLLQKMIVKDPFSPKLPKTLSLLSTSFQKCCLSGLFIV